MLRRLIIVGSRLKNNESAKRWTSGCSFARKISSWPKQMQIKTVRTTNLTRDNVISSSSSNIPERLFCTSRATSETVDAKSLMTTLLAPEKPLPEYEMSFKYVSEGKEEFIRNLTWLVASGYNQSVSEANGKPILINVPGDHNVIRSALFHGMSGSGKTRLALELMGLMRRSLDAEKSPSVSQRYLRDCLSKPRIIYLNWDQGSAQYDAKAEKDWSPKLIVGARLAWKYWFENYPFKVIKQKINGLDPQKRQLFEYLNVLMAIIAENESKNDEDKITALHIINDEFHVTTKSYSQPTESISNVVARVLTQYNTSLFTFSSFVGRSFRAVDIFKNLTEGCCPDFCLPRLSIKSCKEIIAQELGPEWINNSPFLDTMLAIMGGNAGMLEILVKNVARSLLSPEKLYSSDGLKTLEKAILEKYGQEPRLPLIWPTLLSLAGYNIKTSNMPVSATKTKQMTATDIAQTALFSLRSPDYTERWHGWDVSLVMDIPLIFAKWALTSVANQQAPKLVGVKMPTENQLLTLIHQARDLIDYFYLDTCKIELLVLKQLVFRWNMHKFSEPLFVQAGQLFNGGHYSVKFRQRRFKLKNDITTPPIAWVGKGVFDGYLFLEEENGKKVVLKIATILKDGIPTALTQTEIDDLKTKLSSFIVNQPNCLQLLLVVTNCTYTPTAPKDDLDDNICIVARDGLTFGTSPWISLIAQTI